MSELVAKPIEAVLFGMGTDELHKHAPELKRYVDDEAIFVAAEVEDHPVVAHEIHGTAELSLYLGRVSPLRFGGRRPVQNASQNAFLISISRKVYDKTS